jgi:hypothetical protein
MWLKESEYIYNSPSDRKRTKNDNNYNNAFSNRINKDKQLDKLLPNYFESRYVIKKPGPTKHRNMSQGRVQTYKKILSIGVEEKIIGPHLNKSGEKNSLFEKNSDIEGCNSFVDNLISNTEYSSDYPYNIMSNRKEKVANKNNFQYSQSSQEQSTNNHFTLIEESNEIQRPKNTINLSIKNKKNYFSPVKNYVISQPNQLLTDRREHKDVYQKIWPNYDEEDNNCISQPIINIDKEIIYNNIKPKNKKIGRRRSDNSNIYLYTNEEENNFFNNKNINNISKTCKSNKKYLKKPQNFFNDLINDKNGKNYKNEKTNINIKKINPLLERMQKSKMNNNNNNNGNASPFYRKVSRDNNKIKITYKSDQDNFDYNMLDDEYINNSIKNYHNETMVNNYNVRNDFY